VVGCRNGIKHLRGILQRLKAVGAAFWDKKPDPILLGELDAFPFSKGGRPRTQIERHMNVLVLFLFAILIAVSMLLAMAYILWEQQKPDQWYLQLDGSWPWLGINFGGWIIQVIRFMILLYGVIPISLYITLEVRINMRHA
jgi:magnesium-transporting ATPase (P-type)